MESQKNALRLAARQGGIIRLDQALDSGISPSAISRRVRTGEWNRVARSVYRLIAMDDAPNRLRAAIAALPNAVVSHESAAEVHALPRLRRGLAVVTVHSRTTHSFPGVTVHRTRDLQGDQIADVAGLPTTTPERTIVDLAASLHPRHLEAVIDDLATDRRLDIEELCSVADQIARRGKAGSTALRAILSERSAEGMNAASRLERLGMAILRNPALPEPQIEYPAPWDPSKRLDVAYPEALIGIEWDSRRWHSQAAAFQQDRDRDRRALLAGWRVFRFTWQDVTERPYVIVSTILAALKPA
jgi:very-short-patch-repair endonuclease